MTFDSKRSGYAVVVLVFAVNDGIKKGRLARKARSLRCGSCALQILTPESSVFQAVPFGCQCALLLDGFLVLVKVVFG